MKTRNASVWDIFFSIFSMRIIRISFSLKKVEEGIMWCCSHCISPRNVVCLSPATEVAFLKIVWSVQ